ncbi:hypothetical protein DFH94DRAFT_713322 [Russula ochroleuca]|uniref:Secreted protein n=1 Tax=Russula ochroleuca TaxID=152965 RepID=A0A9P5TE34_9AGAM|nr:hypothetical protein DFH94DRAFT_713322 [Russula ochroleuca]
MFMRCVVWSMSQLRLAMDSVHGVWVGVWVARPVYNICCTSSGLSACPCTVAQAPFPSRNCRIFVTRFRLLTSWG